MIFPLVLGYTQEQQYKFEHLTTKQGLAHNMTNCIIQDSKGYIWIGTGGGLSRYDGYNFKTYIRNNDSSSLSGNFVNEIFEDSKGDIWIGTRNYGLNKYNRALDNFQRYLHDEDDTTSLSHNYIESIYEDKRGILWIGTFGGGLNKFDKDTETFTAYKQFPEQPEHLADKINVIFEDYDSTFWIGTNSTAFIFDRNKEIFHPFEFYSSIPLQFRITSTIYQYDHDILWFGTWNGVIKYNKVNNEVTHFNHQGINKRNNLAANGIFKIKSSNIDSQINLWIASIWGLSRLNVETNEITHKIHDPKDPFSLSNNRVLDLCVDNTGNLWIATENVGVNKLKIRENPFQQYLLNTSQDESNYSANCFLLDKAGDLWVGGHSGGLFKLDNEMNIIAHYQPDFYVPWGSDSTELSYAMNLYEDSDLKLWASFWAKGLTIFDPDKNTFIPALGISNNNDTLPTLIGEIFEDRKGRIWIGDAVHGLFVMDKNSKTLKRAYNRELNKANIRDLFEDSKGDFWVGTFNKGLFCLTSENSEALKFIQYNNTDQDSNGYYGTFINSLFEDINGNIWITTGSGLNKYNAKKKNFEVFKQHEELFGAQIMEIFGDSKGNLWLIHSTYGLIRFNPYRDDKNVIKIFTTNDGLPFENFAYRGAYQSKDGRIFIGGSQGSGIGFFSFHPDNIVENNNKPEIVITDFRVNNEIFQLDSNITEIKNIKLKYNQNFFSFEFAALEFANPSQNQYAYFLDGFEDEWIYSKTRRYASYTGVPPDKYTFRVKGSNNDGFWNENGTSITITIIPPPWKTWWAYTIYGIGLITLIYAWRRYDLKRQQLKRELEVEHVEAKKLKELDSMKSRFFANISHEFRTPLTLILGPLQNLLSRHTDEKSKQDLNMMQRNALRLQNLINQLLSLSKLESGKMKLKAYEENIVALVNGYVQSFESLAKQRQIDLNFKSTEENIQVYVDKDKIEKILFNLLSNAFKFTGEEGKIEVCITPLNPPSRGKTHPTLVSSQPGVEIKVSDSGRGIPENQLKHIFDRFYQADDSYSKDQQGTGIGLALTKELVEIHHGNIIVESELGKGTIFNVFLPIGKEHLNPDEIVDGAYKPAKKDESFESIHDFEFSDNEYKQSDNTALNDIEKKEDKPHLLIVDDNTDLRTYIRGYLDSLYYITEARNGEEGFYMATEKIPELIISDVMMPKMDGYELCQKLKADELTSHIPVILLTAKASLEDRLEGLETGADDFIYKPFNGEELHIRVKNLISIRNKLKDRYRKEYNILNNEPDEKIPLMDRQFLDKANSVVLKHLSDSDFSVETFATKLGLSRVQLHRKLRGLLDQSSGDFIRIIRLNKSTELLKEKSGNISEIAYDVGFSSPSYFSECFRQQFGQSPSEFQSHNI